AGFDAEREDGQVKRRRARVHRDGMRRVDPLVRREGRLESRHLGAGSDPAAAQGIGDPGNLVVAEGRRPEDEKVPGGADGFAAVESQAREWDHGSPEEKGSSKYPFMLCLAS